MGRRRAPQGTAVDGKAPQRVADASKTLSHKARHTAKTLTRLHKPTKAVATGVGAAAARAHKVAPGKGPIWNPAVQASLDSILNVTDGRAHTSVAPPQPRVELERWRQVQQLRQWLKAECRRHNVATAPTLAFERWLCRGKLAEQEERKRQTQASANGGNKKTEEEQQDDPVLPCIRSCERGLVADLRRVLPSNKVAKGIARRLADAARDGIAHIQAAARAHDASAWRVRVAVHKHTLDVSLEAATRGRAAKLPRHMFKLNPAHWRKLLGLFTAACTRRGAAASALPPASLATNPNDDAGSGGGEAAAAFRRAVFCLLARYHALQGPGFQAAVVEHAFKELHGTLGVSFECFASPLNCHFPLFCSAFPDTDAVFGSVGSFFDCMPTHGCCEVNPPFIDSLMLAMVRHLELLLSLAATAQLHRRQKRALGEAAAADVVSRGPRPLSFVVVVPGWKEDAAWKLLTKSRFLRATWLIARADHGFCDGAQHQRRDRYRESPYDTTVFVLQTPAAAERWPASAAAERAVRKAFAQGVPTPAMVARRLRDGRGYADADGGGGVYAGRKANAKGPQRHKQGRKKAKRPLPASQAARGPKKNAKRRRARQAPPRSI